MRAKEARLIAIADYLSLAGVKPIKERNGGKELWYSSPIRAGDSDPSFKVDIEKNLWFDFGLSKGGNMVDLVIEHQGATIREALAILEGTGLYRGDVGSGNLVKDKGIVKRVKAVVKKGKGNKERENRDLFPALSLDELDIDSIAGKNNDPLNSGENFASEKEKICAFDILGVSDEINQAVLLDYLALRRISLDVARKYLVQVNYKPRGKKKGYFALGWKCGDGFEARSPGFKGFIGTRKDLIKLNLKDHQSVSIFEGWWDFLAFLTQYRISDFQNSVIILNSINLRQRALDEMKNYKFSKVYLFLDNDEGGIATRDFFKEEIVKVLDVPVVDKSVLYVDYNDFNEMLIAEGSE